LTRDSPLIIEALSRGNVNTKIVKRSSTCENPSKNEPEISDARFMTQAQASDIDNAALRWLFGTLGTSTDVVAPIKGEVERITLRAKRKESRLWGTFGQPPCS
jgi:hypothetical protein